MIIKTKESYKAETCLYNLAEVFSVHALAIDTFLKTFKTFFYIQLKGFFLTQPAEKSVRRALHKGERHSYPHTWWCGF